jgi:hypothetical protein
MGRFPPHKLVGYCVLRTTVGHRVLRTTVGSCVLRRTVGLRCVPPDGRLRA